MANYALEGQKWGSSTFGTTGGTVTWAVDSTIPAYFVSELTAAFAKWSNVGNIKFSQVSSTASASIDFTLAPIDGPSNTLGVASYSYVGNTFQSAEVKFDSAEGWRQTGGGVATNGGSNLLIVATHEIGHAIGLDHYNAVPAVMNAVLSSSVTDLTQSDIDGIRAIYGSAGRAVASVNDAYRFFDTGDGGHFFTTSTAERDTVRATRPDLAFEGVGFKAFGAAQVAGSAPVFRFFDTRDGGHFFTISTSERDTVLATRPDLKFEGVAFYELTGSQGTNTDAVFRFFDTGDGGHFFTSSTAERDQVLQTRPDLKFEGIAFYAPHPGVDFLL